MKKAACILAFTLFSATALAQSAPPPGPPPPGYGPNYGDDSMFDASMHHRGLDLSVMAWIPWYYGLGFGAQARVEIPIVPDGFIPSMNDEFDIEGSFGFAYASDYAFGYVAIVPAAYAIYALHINRAFRVYVGLGLGYDIGVASCDGCGAYNFGGFYWDPVVGLNFKLASSFALRAELGAQGLKGGVQFYF
jgi:hypothetical protein